MFCYLSFSISLRRRGKFSPTDAAHRKTYQPSKHTANDYTDTSDKHTEEDIELKAVDKDQEDDEEGEYYQNVTVIGWNNPTIKLSCPIADFLCFHLQRMNS